MNRLPLLAALGLVILTLLTTGGCEVPAADACESNADCFGGETCQQRRCEAVVIVDIDNRSDGGPGGADAGSGSTRCGEGKTWCEESCVDTGSDSSHCGRCGETCAEGEVCDEGGCVPQVTDCTQQPCVGFTYCDTATGKCEAGCERHDQCGDNEVCDRWEHTCGCEEGFHDCGQGCVPVDAVSACGASCESCSASVGQRALCREGQCIEAPALTRVAAGTFHSCAVMPGGVAKCWGAMNEGQHVYWHLLDAVYTEISAGFWSTCGLTTEGEVSCAGPNTDGESVDQFDDYIQVSSGHHHTCALRTSGVIECWGRDGSGQAPASVPGDFVQVASGKYHSCGLGADGRVQCWGDPKYYQTGTHPLPEATFIQISAGRHANCGLTTSREVVCWGDDTFLNGDAALFEEPSGPFRQVDIGDDHACAVRESGSAIECWGLDATWTVRQQGNFTEVSAGAVHNCALKGNGGLHCWGENDEGQLNSP